RRYRICEPHFRAPSMVINNQILRFCQQCAKFELLTEFDSDKRSCRRQLDRHNARRKDRVIRKEVTGRQGPSAAASSLAQGCHASLALLPDQDSPPLGMALDEAEEGVCSSDETGGSEQCQQRLGGTSGASSAKRRAQGQGEGDQAGGGAVRGPGRQQGAGAGRVLPGGAWLTAQAAGRAGAPVDPGQHAGVGGACDGSREASPVPDPAACCWFALLLLPP
ncbi:SBP domain-containing protein, partial [Haematococcus lacustris]